MSESVVRLDLDAIAAEAEALGWTVERYDPNDCLVRLDRTDDGDETTVYVWCDGLVSIYDPAWWPIVGPLYAAIARHATTTEEG